MKPRNDQYNQIVELYATHTDKQIQAITGKSIATIRSVAVANNLHKKKYYWTKKEDDFLKKNFEECGEHYCADKLKRTLDGVKGRWRKIK